MEKVIIDINRYNELLKLEKEIKEINRLKNSQNREIREIIKKEKEFKFNSIVTLNDDGEFKIDTFINTQYNHKFDILLYEIILEKLNNWLMKDTNNNLELQKEVESKIILYINKLPILKKLSLLH